MIRDSKTRRRGLTLVEILVSSALFGLFTGMVATALIIAHRTEDASVLRLDAIRRASVALDLMVRDLEAAQSDGDVSLNGNTPPVTTPEKPELVPGGLLITRYRQNPAAPGVPTALQSVKVRYWYDPGTGEPGKGMVRRILCDYSGTPLTTEPSDGRILVRDVIDFQISSYNLSSLTFVKADIWVVSIGKDPNGNPIKGPPLTTSIALEPTVPAP